jgi:hypothetical protein
MVFLAITSTGLANALLIAKPDDAVWCGSDAITEDDYATQKHPNLSRFIYALGDRHKVNDAIGTIEDHHPGQVIWVEAAASN